MSDEPEVRKPEGISLQWVTDSVGFDIPCWMDSDLYAEYNKGAEVASILNALAEGIRRAEATSAMDQGRIKFEWWTFLTKRATKRKPIYMQASLYRHPDYDSMWCYIDRRSD